MRKKIILFLVGFGCLNPGLALTSDSQQEANPDSVQLSTPPSKFTLDEVVVIGSKSNAQNLPGSGVYLEAGEIRKHGYADINQILSKVPGVYLRQEEGFGLFPNISLRGADPGRSAKVTIMEDRLLTAPAPYSAPEAYYSPSAGRMSGIEVLKGSSQLKYGPHTTGGVINYISTRIPTTWQYYFKTMFGSDREARVHSYLGNLHHTSSGRWGYLLEYYQQESRGFKRIDSKADFSDTQRAGFRKIDPTIKVSWEPVSSLYQKFEFKLGHADLSADETYLGLTDTDFRENPYRRYSASRFDNFKSEQTRSYLRYTIIPAPRLEITATAYYNKFHRDWFKLRATGEDLLDPARLAVLKGEAAGVLDYRHNNRNYYLGGMETNLYFDLQAGRISHILELGVRYHEDQIRQNQTDVSFLQDGAGNITDRMEGVPGGGGNRKQNSGSVAIFAQDKIETGRLTLTPGLRIEFIDYAYTDYDTKGSPDSVVGKGQSALTLFAPGAGLVYRASRRLSFFGGLYRGYSVPGPRDNALSNLKNETSLGSELGIRYNQGHFRTEVVAFHTYFQDLLVPDNVGLGGLESKTENAGNIRSYGLEFKLGYDAGAAGRWGFSSPTFVALTYTQATLDGDANSLNEESIFAGGKDGARVPYVPVWQAAFGSGLEFKQVGLHLEGTFCGSSYTTANNTDLQMDPNTGSPNANFGKTDDYLIFDATIRYRFNSVLELSASLHNLSDKKYLVSRHPVGPRPGRPRSVIFGIETFFQ